jgi:PQQ-like domain
MSNEKSVSRRAVVFGSFGSVLIGACGGGKGSSIISSGERSAVQFKIIWPTKPDTRLIPSTSQSIVIELSGPTPTTRVVPRPPTGINQTTITFSELSAGAYSITATAYPKEDGTGVPQAQGTLVVTTRAGETVSSSLTMDSTIASMEVSPGSITLDPCPTTGSYSLQVTVRDKNNNIVLINPNNLTWTLSIAGAGKIESNGDSARFFDPTGIKTKIIVTETESGKSGSASVNQYYSEPIWLGFRGNKKNQSRAKGGNIKGNIIKIQPTEYPIFSFIDGNHIIYHFGKTGLTTLNKSGDIRYQTALEIDNNSVVCLTKNDKIITSLGDRLYSRSISGDIIAYSDSIRYPTGISSDDNGNIYIKSSDQSIGGFYLTDDKFNIKWYYPYLPGYKNYSLGSPTIDSNGNVYFNTQDGKIHCFSSNQSLKWISIYGNQISTPTVLEDGSLISYSLANGIAEYVKLDQNGNVIWNVPAPQYSPVPIAVDSTGGFYTVTSYYVFPNTSSVLSYFNSAGSKIWSRNISGKIDTNSTPVVGSDDRCYIVSADNTLYCFEKDSSIKWQINSWISPSTYNVKVPLISPENLLYLTLDNGNLYVIE